VQQAARLADILNRGSRIGNRGMLLASRRGMNAAVGTPQRRKTHGLRHILHENGLSLAVFAIFLVCMGGQVLSGQLQYNEERKEHGESPVALGTYLKSGHFIEATAENWESEFLQMAAYVLFTVFLFQRGSSESKKIGQKEAVDRDPRRVRLKPDTPWPVRRGGWVLRVYENSLSLAFLLLFVVSFVLHVVGGSRDYNEDQLSHGGETLTSIQYLQTSQFWFESFQNWQSEFLSLAAMAVLSIYLRQRGSPESKPVDAAHSDTGTPD
jgi:hypothetical protein